MIVRCTSHGGSSDVSEDNIEAISFIKTFVINLIKSLETKDADSTEESDSINSLGKVDSLILKHQEIGWKYIENIMNEWHDNSCELETWCFHIECINKKIEAPFYFYAYEVKWSKPMEGYTYPIISVNVYMFLTMNSEDCEETIDMKYVFEGNRFVHSECTTFYPKLLIDAYESKKNVIERLNFKYQLE